MNKQLDQFGIDMTRQPFRDQMLAETRRLAQQGETPDALIVMLHQRGASIIESMWVLAQVWNLPLVEVKHLVTAHPVWADLVRATEPLHDALEKAIREPLSDW